jgi:hypothetical protein
VRKVQAKFLDAQHNSGPEVLAEFAAGVILDAILTNQIESSKPLDNQFVQLIEVFQKPRDSRIQAFFNKVRPAIKTKDGDEWRPGDVFAKVGVKTTEGVLYWSDNCDTEIYGFCIGSKEMATARGYQKFAHSLPANNGAISRPRPKMTRNMKIANLKNQRAELTNTLEKQRHNAAQLANEAQIEELKRKLEDTQRRLEKLEKSVDSRTAQNSRTHENQYDAPPAAIHVDIPLRFASDTSSDSEE